MIKTESKEVEVLWQRLADLERNVWRINSKIVTVTSVPSIDRCLLEQCNRQITGFETEMFYTCIFHKIATVEETKELTEEKLGISDVGFNLGLKMNRFLSYPKEAITKPFREGIRQQKITLPTFWWRSKERFEISIHSKEQLTNTEKMAYLWDTVKSGGAKQVIEGLAQTADTCTYMLYKEAISCLQSHYNRPLLIHQVHVRAMLEVTSLKMVMVKKSAGPMILPTSIHVFWKWRSKIHMNHW